MKIILPLLFYLIVTSMSNTVLAETQHEISIKKDNPPIAAKETKPVPVKTDKTGKKDQITPLLPKKRRQEIIAILKQDCGSCHGMTLKGGLGPSLTPDALKKMSTEQIVATITYGRAGTPMPPWKPFFNQAETLWLAQQLQHGIEDKKE